MMEMMIKLDENVFTRLFDHGTEDYAIVNDDLFAIANSIRKGTPLPKGHGRLIDEKEVYKKFYCRCLAGVAKEVLDEISPIIEADAESDDEYSEGSDGK